MRRLIEDPKQKQLIISIVTVATLTALFFLFIHLNTKQLYMVKIGATELGYISSPNLVDKWVTQRNKQLAKQYPRAKVLLDTSKLSVSPVEVFLGKPKDEKLVSTMSSFLEAKAYGIEVVINGQEVGIVKDRKTAEQMIAYFKNRQIAQIDKQTTNVQVLSAEEGAHDKENQSKTEIESIQFVEPYEFRDVTAKPEQIVDPRKVLKVIEVGKVGETNYTVQEGDCVSCIAQKFNIPPSIIYSNNPWIEEDRITVGDRLNLTVKQPLLSIRTIEKIVEREEIQYSTTYKTDETLRVGATRDEVKGKQGLREITLRVTKIGGEIVEEETLKEEVLEEPVNAVVVRGTKIIPGEGTGSFSMPVRGARLSSRYGMRGGRMHKGLDFTSGNRTILAADTGRVIFTGFQNGYGNTIVIDHRNGYQTKYAHLSRIQVRSGENVEKGDAIGIMGNTGNSDGIHLHFEIFQRGVVVNPSKYLYR